MVDNTELVKFRRQWQDELENKTSQGSVDSPTGSPKHQSASAEQASAQQASVEQSSPLKHWPPTLGDAAAVDNQSIEEKNPSTSREDNESQYEANSSTKSDLLGIKFLNRSLVHNLLNYEKNTTVVADEKDKIEEFYHSRNKRLKLSWEDIDKPAKKDDSFVDLFIKDLDEISGIPFFGCELPRDVAFKIFQHLDPVMLCRCAQVSKSWNIMVEDELLWNDICHKLGYEEDTSTVDKTSWKQIVKTHILQEIQLRQNWRMRTGTVEALEYVQGGILYAVNSFKYTVVAGYSNGEVKVWDIDNDDCFKLSPSSIALQIDEGVELGTVGNELQQVCVNDRWVAASYTQGNIDIWDMSQETKQPIHSVLSLGKIQNLECNINSLIFSSGSVVNQHALDLGGDFPEPGHYDVGKKILHMCSIPNSSNIIVAFFDQVNVLRLGSDDVSKEIHHTVGHHVTCIDSDPSTLAVGVQKDWDCGVVRLYDLSTGQEGVQLEGHAKLINLKDSPSNSLVTGYTNQVKIFDTRLTDAVHTFRINPGYISCVEMDDWKVVFGDDHGSVHVWDQRMAAEMWDQRNRHPVRYVTFMDGYLVTANIPKEKYPEADSFETTFHSRHRGSLYAYNFSVDQTSQGVNLPSNVLSTYEDPEGYNYNIGLAVPYDAV